MKHAPFGLACCRIFVQQICILILKPNLNVTSYLVFFPFCHGPQQAAETPPAAVAVPCPGFACALPRVCLCQGALPEHCHCHWTASCYLLYSGCFICQETGNLPTLSVVRDDNNKRYKSDSFELQGRGYSFAIKVYSCWGILEDYSAIRGFTLFMDLYQEARNKGWNCGFAPKPLYGYLNAIE